MSDIYYHADDFGYTKGISKNIIEAIDNGYLSSLSIMPNGTYLEIAKKKIKKKKLKHFIHINLTEGKSITKNKNIKKYLLDKNGNFKYSFFKLNLFWLFSSRKIKNIVNDVIYNEIKAQIRIAQCSKELRIDSHEHIHMSPFVFNQILKINKKKKINQIRLSKDFLFLKPYFFFKKYFYLNLIKYIVLLFLSIIHEKKLTKLKINFDDYCFGILHSGNMTLDLINSLKKKIKNKKFTIQILVHPGYSNKNDKKNFNTLKNWSYYNSKNRFKDYNLMKRNKL